MTMSAPRHRLETAALPPLVSYEPPIPVRAIDFDAVAPMRKPASERKTAPTPLETSDALYLAHS
jgi:hypothetical protein